ncbi:RusA family crossover junction endodeoxyribonuclease [Nocardia vinacea]|uniref:RusA family crossover junction endodeoxyribonuclease n=1 Tax=Nocardia vinacea TaxID=96468 RepID=A0ABZ1YI30_9NOCA|nr:RusA family crossover junction endodeoxyribonuclease [Nocardia vinacea]
MIPPELIAAAEAVANPLYVVTIPHNPHPKGRPRFGRGRRAYTDPVDVDLEALTAAYLRAAVPEPLRSNVALGCVFYRSTRRVVDGDNLLKHVMDAANGIAWLDDSQCTAKLAAIELDRANPRSVILIGTHSSTLTRNK